MIKVETLLCSISFVWQRVPRSYQEGATTFQNICEQLLLSEPQMLELGKQAYLSYIRFYASYRYDSREVFNFKKLHLGHYAKSFALRDAPTSLGAGAAMRAQAVHKSKQEKKQRVEKNKMRGVIAQKRGAVPKMATMSEFDSGLDNLTQLLSKEKMSHAKRHQHVKTNNRGPTYVAKKASVKSSKKMQSSSKNKGDKGKRKKSVKKHS